jgi:predicted phosphoadenosine phosphosulfate sulfurtransferase
MSMYKYPLDKNVLEAALDRINWVLIIYPESAFHFPAGRTPLSCCI